MSTHNNIKSKSSKSVPVVAPAPVPVPVQTQIDRNQSSSDLSTANDSVDETSEVVKKQRAVITKDSILASFDEIITLVQDEILNIKDGQNKSKGVKFLRTLNKKLKTLKNHSSRIIKQKSAKKASTNTNSGFQKPVRISKEMAKFAGWNPDELKSRVAVTKVLCTYIKDNNLQNKADRRQIVADTKLAKLLKYDSKTSEPLTYFALQKCLKSHFPKDVVKVSAVSTTATA